MIMLISSLACLSPHHDPNQLHSRLVRGLQFHCPSHSYGPLSGICKGGLRAPWTYGFWHSLLVLCVADESVPPDRLKRRKPRELRFLAGKTITLRCTSSLQLPKTVISPKCYIQNCLPFWKKASGQVTLCLHSCLSKSPSEAPESQFIGYHQACAPQPEKIP